MFRSTCVALTLMAAFAGAGAQSQQASAEAQFVETFSGDWYSFDPRSSDAGTCLIKLSPDATAAGAVDYAATTSGCSNPLGTVTSWRIIGGQIRLFAGDTGSELAALGGNQFRITGTITSGAGAVILERATGDASSRAISQAISTYKCIFRGATDTCATADDLTQVSFSGDTPPAIQTLVNLTVRDQPRADAPSVGVVPRDTVVTVEQCLTTSDGVWCAARFGDTLGWFTRTALRQQTWPVLTFVAVTTG